MRKILFLFIATSLMFSGCGKNQQGESYKAPQENNQGADDKERKGAATITQAAHHAWKDSIGTVWAHGSIEIKNTGNVPVRIGDIQISFVDANKSILGNLTMVLPVPRTLTAGETAYAGDSTTLEGVGDPDKVVNIEANIDYTTADDEDQALEIQDLKIVDKEYGGVKVTGRVKNTSSSNSDDTRIIVALMDSAGKLLGIVQESLTVTLSPDQSMGFEAGYPEIKVKAAQVKNMIGKSYAWKF